MTQFKSTMEILKILEKSNCRECGLPSCLVFSLAVFKGEKSLSDCPRLDPDMARQYEPDAPVLSEPHTASRQDGEESIEALRKQITGIDLAAAANRIGGAYDGSKLTLKVMGKDFSVDAAGRLFSDIHINQWVAGPFFNYILNGRGLPPRGKWVPLRELKGGLTWHAFFIRRCEKPLKDLADTYPDFFKNLMKIFNGRPVQNHYQSDISLVLFPLPRLPLLICYWKPDEGLPSTLNLFFDITADKNLPMESLYGIGAGLANMFEKLALRHG